MADTPIQDVDVVESQGISWGKWLFRGALVLGAALAAPVLMDKVAELTAGDTGLLGSIGETAGKWSEGLSSYYATAASSVGIDKIGTDAITGDYFQNILGDKNLTQVLSQGASNAWNYVGDNPVPTALTAGAAALGSLAILGPHTKRIVVSRAEPGIPVGQSLA